MAMIETLQADIDLADRTLQFLGDLTDEQIPAAVRPKVRDIGMSDRNQFNSPSFYQSNFRDSAFRLFGPRLIASVFS